MTDYSQSGRPGLTAGALDPEPVRVLGSAVCGTTDAADRRTSHPRGAPSAIHDLPPAPSKRGRACDGFVEAGHRLCKTDYGRHNFEPPLVSSARVAGGLFPMLRVVTRRGRSGYVASGLTGAVPAAAADILYL